jgi:formyl-CoA transferase
MDPVPGLGEHTESILRELGRSEQDIDRLRTEHVVG